MGERSPHNDADARGAFIGMSMDTSRKDMTQAVMEGVAFGLRDSLEVARKLGIKIDSSKICGGGVQYLCGNNLRKVKCFYSFPFNISISLFSLIIAIP